MLHTRTRVSNGETAKTGVRHDTTDAHRPLRQSVNQGWSGVHAIVESREFRELSSLGEPTHTEGDLNAWIL